MEPVSVDPGAGLFREEIIIDVKGKARVCVGRHDDRLFYLGHILRGCQVQWKGGSLRCKRFAGRLVFIRQAVNVVRLVVVDRRLILYPEEDEYGGCEAGGQAEKVDKTGCPIFQQAAESGL